MRKKSQKGKKWGLAEEQLTMMIEMKKMSQNVNNVAETLDVPTYKPK